MGRPRPARYPGWDFFVFFFFPRCLAPSAPAWRTLRCFPPSRRQRRGRPPPSARRAEAAKLATLVLSERKKRIFRRAGARPGVAQKGTKPTPKLGCRVSGYPGAPIWVKAGGWQRMEGGVSRLSPTPVPLRRGTVSQRRENAEITAPAAETVKANGMIHWSKLKAKRETGLNVVCGYVVLQKKKIFPQTKPCRALVFGGRIEGVFPYENLQNFLPPALLSSLQELVRIGRASSQGIAPNFRCGPTGSE